METSRFTIGAEVRCSDRVCGRLDRVVFDPVACTLTHLVVVPRVGTRRLVPVELVDETAGHGDDAVRLRCAERDFGTLEPAEETDFLPVDEDRFGYGPEQMMLWPYFGLGAGAVRGDVSMGMPGIVPDVAPRSTSHDRVPSGEVQIRRGQRVAATDGEIGRVQGLVIDPHDHAVTHVLLQEGHLWGRKTVAIPIRAVSCTRDAVRVALSRSDLGRLPPVDLGPGG